MRRRIAIFLSVAAVALLATAGTAMAQLPADYAEDLRDFDVIYDPGAVGIPNDDAPQLRQLDQAVAPLQEDGAFFKVIVLADPVTRFDSTREFAEAVLADLGGSGRILVYGLTDVGIGSNLDNLAAVSDAESAAREGANTGSSYAAGVEAAAASLGVEGSADSSDSSSDGGSSGGSFAWLWVVLIVGVLVVGGLFLWSRLKKSKARESAVSLGEGEMKVRSHQDQAGNLVLDLADRVELPGAPPEAKQLFQQGAAEFAGLQDDLEQADTRPELEAVYPRIVDAVWKLESAKAVLDGQPAPAQPAAEPLFPAPPAPVAPAQPAGGAPLGPVDVGQQYQTVPEPSGYRSMGSSPWLTTAATAALSMLAGRMMAPDRSYRPPASDDMFSMGGGRRSRGRGSSSPASSGWQDIGGGGGGRGRRRGR